MGQEYVSLMMAGTPTKHRIVALSTTAAYDSEEAESRRMLRIFADAADVHYRYSPNPVFDPGFETQYTWASDAEGAVLGSQDRVGIENEPPNNWQELGGQAAVTLNKTAPLTGLRDAKISQAQTEKVLNGGLNAWTAGVPDNWTETDVGDGTVVEDTTNKVEGTSSAALDGGTTGGGTNILQNIAIPDDATKVYVLRAYLGFCGSDPATVVLRLIDTVNNKSLDSNGVWQAGATTALWTDGTNAAFTRYEIRFKALAGATNLRIQVIVPTAADAGNVDAVSLSEVKTELVQQGAFKLAAGRAYVLGFGHKESAALMSANYAITETLDDDSGGIKWLQADGSWSATENWFNVLATSKTDVRKTFTSDLERYYTVRFSPGSIPAGHFFLDDVFIAEVALVTDAELPSGIQEYLLTTGRGRISAIAGSGTPNLSIAEMT
jgi:hypothetical protein